MITKKPRILCVVTSLRIGGAEKLIMESTPMYKEMGFPIDVFIFHSEETEFSKELRENKINILKSFKSHLYNPVHIIKLASVIKNYDIVHVHLFPGLYWVAMAKIISFSKAKLVYTEHSTSNRRRNNIFRWFDKIIYKKYSKVVAISKEVGLLMKAHLGLPDSKFLLIRNGINLNRIRKALPLNENFFPSIDNAKLIIQVSSFRKQKDQKTLIEALQILPSNIRLILVGDGPLREDCEKLASRLGVVNRICFLGLRMDVPRLLKTSDIIVLSSVHEGLSLSSIEGLASGRPFIASSVPGLKDIVEGAGLLFPKGNRKILADHITNLLANEKYYNSVTQSCIERSREYDIKTMVDSYASLYSSLIN